MSKQVKALKLPLEGIQEAFFVLDGQSKICNWLYNSLLEKADELKKEFIATKNFGAAKIVYTKRGLRNLVPELKKQFPFLKSVHSSPLKNAALRLSSAIRAHQNNKKIRGWPKFRSWHTHWFSLLYDEPGKGYKVEGDNLTLTLGVNEEKKRLSLQLKIQNGSLLKGKEIHNLRITKELDTYWAIFTVSVALPKKKSISRIIALDPNHKNLSYGVDNEGKSIEIVSPNWLKTIDRRIDEIKQKRDQCKRKAHLIKDARGKEHWKSSKQWRKREKVLERALKKRREQTKTFLYTLSHVLYQNYDCVGIGSYTPHGEGENKKMRRAMNNRSLIGRLKETLLWVSMKSGKTFIEYDERGTTRSCNRCHHILSEGLIPSIRVWECPSCKTVHHRDENSAENGLQIIMDNLEKKLKVSCSDPISPKEWWAWRVLASGVEKTPRGQNGIQLQTPGN